ncbi:hypothetical protein PAMP_000901 [Pampus punctatissimus]
MAALIHGLLQTGGRTQSTNSAGFPCGQTTRNQVNQPLGNSLEGDILVWRSSAQLAVYRRQASSRLAALEEAAEGRTASYQREILHLQRLLRERQEAEERLLQSKR